MGLENHISFDGSKFWLDDEIVGEVQDKDKFRDNYDKSFIDRKKTLILGKIRGGEV